VTRRASSLAIHREIAARVRRRRIAAGLTQEEAASRASIGYKRWQEIEGGRVNLTIRTIARVAAALDADFWDIVRPHTPRRKPRRMTA